LIAALAGFSGWLYVGAKGLESKVSDLQTKTDNLEAQNAELSTQMQNLTSTLENLTSGEGFSSTQTEQITYTGYMWGTGDKNVTLTVENTGASTLSIENVEVDGSTATNVKINGATWAYGTSVQLTIGSSVTIVITQNFVSGYQYNFMIVTARGNQFGPYTLTAP
jgi:hypothetical protein